MKTLSLQMGLHVFTGATIGFLLGVPMYLLVWLLAISPFLNIPIFVGLIYSYFLNSAVSPLPPFQKGIRFVAIAIGLFLIFTAGYEVVVPLFRLIFDVDAAVFVYFGLYFAVLHAVISFLRIKKQNLQAQLRGEILQLNYMKTVGFIIIAIICLVLSVGIIYILTDGRILKDRSVKILVRSDSEIVLTDRVISIDEFPDVVQVSPDSAFGNADSFYYSHMSPDNKWLAIITHGAAHDFGWVYNIETREITPVAFAYGGGLTINKWNWRNEKEVIFELNTANEENSKPIQRLINVDHLPQYAGI